MFHPQADYCYNQSFKHLDKYENDEFPKLMNNKERLEEKLLNATKKYESLNSNTSDKDMYIASLEMVVAERDLKLYEAAIRIDYFENEIAKLTKLPPKEIQELALEYFTQDNTGLAYPIYIVVANGGDKRWTEHNFFLTPSGYKKHMELNAHNYYGKVSPMVKHARRNPEMELFTKYLYQIFKEIATPEQLARLHSITSIYGG